MPTLLTPRKKTQALDVIQNVFLSKATLNFVGFVLKAAIVCSITNQPIHADGGEVGVKDPDVKRVGGALLTYLVLVSIVVIAREAINKKTQSLTLSKDRADTLKAFLGGLNLIPAWGFKDLVAVLIAGTAWWSAIIVLFAATVLACVIEPPPPPAGEVPTLFENLRKTLSGCMTLGVGFAMHTIPVTVWRNMGYAFYTIPVTGIYALVLTCVVIYLQVTLKKVKAGVPDEQKYYKTFLTFFSASGNFMSAWAWDSLLEALRRYFLTMAKDTCTMIFWINMGWALFVLVVGVTSIVGIHLQVVSDDMHTPMEDGLEGLAKIIAACCVAWAFMDVFKGVYKCMDYGEYRVLGAWIMAAIVLVLAVCIMHFGTIAIERAKPQNQAEG